MYLLMTLGSCTVRRSLPTLAGIPCQGFFGVAPAFPLVLDLVSASSEDLGGAGITGTTTGMAVEHSSIITNGVLTVGILVTTGSIMVTSITATAISAMAASSTTATRSTEAGLAVGIRVSTGLRLLTFRQERAPERSVALTTVEMSEAFPLAGGRALEVVSMEAVFMAAADGIR
jgi:hypothetical protein